MSYRKREGNDEWEDTPVVTLVVEGSTGSVLTYRVRRPSVSIGASSSNDIVVRAPGVAPKHLVVQRTGDRFTFITQARQTVVLNGERRSRGVLRVGDRVRIGTAVLVFQGAGDENGEPAEDAPAVAPEEGPGTTAGRGTPAKKSELVVYNEPGRLAEARQALVQLFRGTGHPEVLPSLQGFFERYFDGSQVMLAWRDEDGRLRPLTSSWTGDPPDVPARAFEQLLEPGRYTVIRRGYRELGIWPVVPDGYRPSAFLLLDASGEIGEGDRVLAAEMATMLAVEWERVESTGALYSTWEETARKQIAEALPGTSRSIELLRDNVLAAARSHGAVLIVGRPGSGRTFSASLIARLNPSGALPVEIVQGREGDPEVIRSELFGRPGRGGGVVERMHGGVIVVRDVHLLPVQIQREIAASIQAGEAAGPAARVRWIVTVPDNLLEVVNEGKLDPSLFSAVQGNLLSIPSLASRREDLPLIVVRLLDMITAEQGKTVRGIALETLNALLRRSWEGEMVELLGELRRLVSATPPGEMVRGDLGEISTAGEGLSAGSGVGELFPFLEESDDLKVVIPAVERLLIDRVLRRVKGNQSKAARILNISRGALIAKAKEYDIPDYRYLRRQRG